MLSTKKPASVNGKGAKIAKIQKKYHLEKWKWKKGQSGNPSGGPGRPPSKHISQIAKEYGEQPHGKTGKTKDEHALELLYRRGCQGNDKAMSTWLAYRWGRPVEQTVSFNANANMNEPQMSIEEVDQKLTGMFERMGIPRAVATPSGLKMDLNAVQARVNELIEKQRQKALPGICGGGSDKPSGKALGKRSWMA
jgi:hypothetical protein